MRRNPTLEICAAALLLTACTGGGGGGGAGGQAGPASLSYPEPDGHYLVQVSIDDNTPAVQGPVEFFSVAPILPAGFTWNAATGTISGTPQVAIERTPFVITAHGPGGQVQTVIHISVDHPPRFAFSASPDDDTLSAYVVDAGTGALRFHGFRHHLASDSGPQEIVFHPEGRFAFVPNRGLHKQPSTLSIYAVDPDSGRLSPAGEAPTGIDPQRIALSPDGRNAYSISFESNEVHSYAVDPGTGALQLLGVQTTNTGPKRLAVDPLGRFVWVTHGPSADVTIFAVNPLTGALDPFHDGINYWGFVPTDVVVDATGTFAYISFEGINTLLSYRIHPQTGTLMPSAETPTVGLPRDLALPPYWGYLYVADEDQDNVSIYALDPDDGVPVHVEDVPVGDAPIQVTFDESGRYAYVLNSLSDDVSVFTVDVDTGSLTPAGRIRTRSGANTFTVYGGPRPAQPRAEFLYVLNQESEDVASFSIEAATGKVTPNGTSVFTGTGPEALAADPDGRFLFVANRGGGDLSTFAITSGTGRLVEGAPRHLLGGSPQGIAVDPAGTHLFVTLRESRELVAFSIDPGTGLLTETDRASTGVDPHGVAVDPTGQFVYVSNIGGAPSTISAYRFQDGLFVGTPTTVAAPGAPGLVRFSPDGTHAYVALTTSQLLAPYVIEPATGALTAEASGIAPTPLRPNVIEIHPSGRLAFAAVPGLAGQSGHIAQLAVDPVSGSLTELGSTTEGLGPFDLRVDPAGGKLHVINKQGDDLSVFQVDAQTGALKLEARLPVGLRPQALIHTTTID